MKPMLQTRGRDGSQRRRDAHQRHQAVKDAALNAAHQSPKLGMSVTQKRTATEYTRPRFEIFSRVRTCWPSSSCRSTISSVVPV
jgi:hypothetical protein